MGALASLFGLASRSDLDSLRAQNATLQRRLKAAQGEASGTDVSWGRFGYELNEAFTGAKKWQTLDKMEADPRVKGALRFNILPILGADWLVKAASDKPRDKRIAGFVAANLLCQSNEYYGRDYWPTTSWEQRLFEKLQMLRDGFSIQAFTMRRQGSNLVYDRIHWLEPSTVDGMRPWVTDSSDNLLGVNRTFSDPATDQYRYDKFLPVSFLRGKRGFKIGVWEFRGGRWEGRSFFRSLYAAWFSKDFAQRQGLMWVQKNAAPPPMGQYPPDWNQDVIDDFIDFVQSCRGTSPAEAHFAGPMGAQGEATVKYIGAEHGEVDRIHSFVDGLNAEIAAGAGGKSALLGETSSGTRSLGREQRQGDMSMVSAMAKILCSQLNFGVGNVTGEVQHLVDMNFSNIKAYPVVVCSRIDPDEGLKAMERLTASVREGIVPNVPALRKQVTERYGFKLPDDAFEKDPEPRPSPFGPQRDSDRAGERGDDGTPARRRPEDRGEREMAVARLESREQFRERVAPLLVPVEKEDSAPVGGRFPDAARADGMQSRGGAGDVQGGRTGPSGDAAGGA